MDLGLAGQVAIVTGGSKGIGKAVAASLIAEGARVALFARGQEALDAAVAELGVSAIGLSVDTTSTASVDDGVAAVVEQLGRLDVVVNAAATPASSIPSRPGIAALDEVDFIDQLDTKALGYLRVVRASVPHLRAAGGGRIVNISGMNARRTGAIASSVRNVAVVALTKNLADELGRDNIAVTCVHPGMTRTDSRELTEKMLQDAESNALGRVIDASEVAALVTFLASPAAVLTNGAIITADGSTPGVLFT